MQGLGLKGVLDATQNPTKWKLQLFAVAGHGQRSQARAVRGATGAVWGCGFLVGNDGMSALYNPLKGVYLIPSFPAKNDAGFRVAP